MKYIKKPIPVDAWQIDLLELVNQGNYPDWVETARVQNQITINSYAADKLSIYTLEGKMVAAEGDYLIKGPEGEYWFNKKDIFEKMYEIYTGD